MGWDGTLTPYSIPAPFEIWGFWRYCWKWSICSCFISIKFSKKFRYLLILLDLPNFFIFCQKIKQWCNDLWRKGLKRRYNHHSPPNATKDDYLIDTFQTETATSMRELIQTATVRVVLKESHMPRVAHIKNCLPQHFMQASPQLKPSSDCGSFGKGRASSLPRSTDSTSTVGWFSKTLSRLYMCMI